MNKKPLVGGIGELLWDVLPGSKQVGGAPCNFTYHAMQSGCESILFSAVGNDKLGDELLFAIEELNISCEFIQRNSFPTGTVTVTLNEKGHPQYVIHENVAWDNIELDTKTRVKTSQLDAICFGTLGQRDSVSAATIKQVLNLLKPNCLKVFDINLRQNFYSPEIITNSLQYANILKMSDEELPVLSELFGLSGDLNNRLKQLLNRFLLQYIVYTMGEKGSIIMNNNHFSFIESPKIIVADTVGAGDSFTAVFVAGLLQGFTLNIIHEAASRTAAFVCTQKGGTPAFNFDVF